MKNSRDMTIPEVRGAMKILLEQMDGHLIELQQERNDFKYLVSQLYRRPAVTQAPVKSRRMTVGLAATIRAYHAKYPTLSQQAIATQFGVSAGRVSEVLAGKRGE